MMNQKYNKTLIPNARNLRKNMTKEERHLWYDYLKTVPHKFVRQKVLGKYIADFYCASAKLVIELDGSQHYEAAGIEYDKRRTEYLESFGIRVIRISNDEVNRNFIGVCEFLDAILNDIPSVACGASSPCNKGSL